MHMNNNCIIKIDVRVNSIKYINSVEVFEVQMSHGLSNKTTQSERGGGRRKPLTFGCLQSIPQTVDPLNWGSSEVLYKEHL